MVEIEKLDGGGWRVSRVLPCAASMQAAASALERIVPEAYAVQAKPADTISVDAYAARRFPTLARVPGFPGYTPPTLTDGPLP